MRNAGDFMEKLDILEFIEIADGLYSWETVKTVYSAVEKQSGGSIFSRYGVTARSMKLVIRALPCLTLHNAAWLHEGGHLFITDIDKTEHGFYTLSAAVIEPVMCKVERRSEPSMDGLNRPEFKALAPLIFPGYLTEKYLRQYQGEPMSYSETRYVLITPKSVQIRTGALVSIGGDKYETVIPHVLDPYKNEYEILRRHDN